MDDQSPPIATTNPFATRWVRPGAVRFQFPADTTASGLVARLEANGWWGEIVGPHGSGKSALLAVLAPAIEKTGRRVIRFELHNGQRRLPLPLGALEADARTVVIVDGYEQLGRWYRWRLRRRLQRQGAGLVVTTHISLGLPRLHETSVSLELAQRLTAELTRTHASPVTPHDVARLYPASGGNLRELFFVLYDLHEARSR